MQHPHSASVGLHIVAVTLRQPLLRLIAANSIDELFL